MSGIRPEFPGERPGLGGRLLGAAGLPEAEPNATPMLLQAVLAALGGQPMHTMTKTQGMKPREPGIPLPEMQYMNKTQGMKPRRDPGDSIADAAYGPSLEDVAGQHPLGGQLLGAQAPDWRARAAELVAQGMSPEQAIQRVLAEQGP